MAPWKNASRAQDEEEKGLKDWIRGNAESSND